MLVSISVVAVNGGHSTNIGKPANMRPVSGLVDPPSQMLLPRFSGLLVLLVLCVLFMIKTTSTSEEIDYEYGVANYSLVS